MADTVTAVEGVDRPELEEPDGEVEEVTPAKIPRVGSKNWTDYDKEVACEGFKKATVSKGTDQKEGAFEEQVRMATAAFTAGRQAAPSADRFVGSLVGCLR